MKYLLHLAGDHFRNECRNQEDESLAIDMVSKSHVCCHPEERADSALLSLPETLLN